MFLYLMTVLSYQTNPNLRLNEGEIMNTDSRKSDSIKAGCGIGNIIALAFSIVLHNSLLWNILHFMFGWMYVVWAIIMHFHELQNYFGL